MPFYIVKNDITKMKTQAIVNAANHSLLGGAGVDGAIHRAAGPELLQECRGLRGCNTGDAKITRGYKLKAKYVIHTVGPIYIDGNHGEKHLLESAYRSSLELAKENGIKSISFPLISAGAYGYPKDQAMDVAIDTIKSFLEDNEMEIFLVLYTGNSRDIKTEYSDLNQYLEENLQIPYLRANKPAMPRLETIDYDLSLKDRLDLIDEGFSEMLLRLIDDKGLDDVSVYKKANIDRKHFSKIRSNKDYRPKKETVLAFALALELDMDETEEMLMKAGYAFSNASKFDVIIQYFIEHKNYDIFEVNKALYYYDQKLLG